MIQTNLKELLNKNNISINRLSIETGLSRPTLTSLMNNESKGIQFDTLEKLVNYFEISISEFFNIQNQNIEFGFVNPISISRIKNLEESSFSKNTNENFVEYNPSEVMPYECYIATDGELNGSFSAVLTPVMDNKKIVAIGLVFYNSNQKGEPLPIHGIKTFIKKLDSKALGTLVEKFLINWYKRYKIVKKSDFSDIIITNLTLLDEQPVTFPVFVNIKRIEKDIYFDLEDFKSSGYKKGDEDYSNLVTIKDLVDD